MVHGHASTKWIAHGGRGIDRTAKSLGTDALRTPAALHGYTTTFRSSHRGGPILGAVAASAIRSHLLTELSCEARSLRKSPRAAPGNLVFGIRRDTGGFGRPSAEERAASIYVKAGRLLDGVSADYQRDMVVVIEGDRIKSIEQADAVTIPAGAVTLDLSTATVLPGLIDCHTHLGGRADRFDEIYKFKDTPNHSAFAAVLNARKTLDAGFTTVRDVGSRPFLAVDLRDAIDEGFLAGPRIVASGPGISMTGGHGDLNRYAPQVRVESFPDQRGFKIADGPDQVRQVARRKSSTAST